MSVAVQRRMQLEASESARETTDLALLWHGLLAARFFVVDTYCSHGRCYALLEHARGRRRPRPSGIGILQRVFQGESQKVIASELRLSVATVSCHSMRALRAVARQHHVSRAPIVLVMAALAACGLRLEAARLEEVRTDGRWLISVEVPGQSLRARLSASEWQVARLAIEGETHAEMARARGTSERTIANQLAAVFDKLGAFGRSELRAMAVREAGGVALAGRAAA